MKRWKKLCKDWSGCQSCKIGQLADNHVFGTGFIPADFVLIGEGPGRSEDALGEPFVGPAGRLLNKALDKSDMESFKIFKTNLVSCRPTDDIAGPNRQPTHREMENCFPRLKDTINIVGPKAVVALGVVAASFLTLQGINHIKMHHPAYVLRMGGTSCDLFKDYVKSFKRICANLTVQN